MAAISWTERRLKGGAVKLTGTTTLSCRHTLKEEGRVRDNPNAIAQGKQTITRLLTTLTTAHVKECQRP